jgi:Na+/H+ antiporter NhaD/arsenite permease-like protein
METDIAAIISVIIVMSCFIGVLICIMTDKVNKAIAALIGALIAYFTLIFINHADSAIFIGLLFGDGPGYDNLHALVLIIGMLFIVQICTSAGVFQFIAVKVVKMTSGKPFLLLIAICSITLLATSVLGGILAIVVLIPLTIIIFRILGLDPIPYLLCQAIMIPIGEIIFSISSIPAILITTSAGIGFTEFFLNVGLFCLFLFLLTLFYFKVFYRRTLKAPKKKLVTILLNFNAWNYVPDKGVFYKSILVFISVIICFIAIPPTMFPPDVIALTGAVILVVINRLNGREIIKKLDLELLLYLLGIFLITGAIEHIGVIGAIGEGLKDIVGGNPLVLVLSVLWLSAFLSATIDDIPVIKVLIPVVDIASAGFHPAYFSLAFGTTLGDNLTPLGDTVMIRNIAEQHGRPFSSSAFFKIGFKVALIHLTAVSIYFIFFNNVVMGLLIVFFIILLLFLIVFIQYLQRSFKTDSILMLSKGLRKLKDQKYRIHKKLIFREVSWRILRPYYQRNWKSTIALIIKSFKRFLKEML